MKTMMLTGSVSLLAQAGSGSGAGAATGGADWSYAIAAGLFLAAVTLMLLEIFIPSGGILGGLALLTLISGVVMCFQINTTLGLVSAIMALIGLPVVVGLGLKLAPETPVFKMLSLKAKQTPVVGSMASAGIDKLRGESGEITESDSAASSSLVGKTGQALSDLRPVGTCLIDGKREECLAASSVIQRGTPVEVISEDGMTIKVRAREA
ncbi:MAG: NfeD family protein [Phycisphaeraceae bacterium]